MKSIVVPSWCSEWPGRALRPSASRRPATATQYANVSAPVRHRSGMPTGWPALRRTVRAARAMARRSSITIARTRWPPLSPARAVSTRSGGTSSGRSAVAVSRTREFHRRHGSERRGVSAKTHAGRSFSCWPVWRRNCGAGEEGRLTSARSSALGWFGAHVPASAAAVRARLAAACAEPTTTPARNAQPAGPPRRASLPFACRLAPSSCRHRTSLRSPGMAPVAAGCFTFGGSPRLLRMGLRPPETFNATGGMVPAAMSFGCRTGYTPCRRRIPLRRNHADHSSHALVRRPG